MWPLTRSAKKGSRRQNFRILAFVFVFVFPHFPSETMWFGDLSQHLFFISWRGDSTWGLTIASPKFSPLQIFSFGVTEILWSANSKKKKKSSELSSHFETPKCRKRNTRTQFSVGQQKWVPLSTIPLERWRVFRLTPNLYIQNPLPKRLPRLEP